jgi:hypothetical protein
MRRVAALALVLACAAASRASAGESPCWIDNGAVVVPAVFTPAGLDPITGDFILDLSTPHSQLHLTAAQGAGVGGGADDPTAVRGAMMLAGERLDADLAVADLDARQWGFPTGIDGLIGADLMAGYVVELRVSPCRFALLRRGDPGQVVRRLPLRQVSGAPTIAATVSDGVSTRAGRFAIDTGGAGVRISADAARFSRLSASVDPLSRGHPPARLAALRFGGVTLRDQPAALATDLPAGVLGAVGVDVWAPFVLRLDLRRGELDLIAPAPDPPALSAPRCARSAGSWRRAGRRR